MMGKETIGTDCAKGSPRKTQAGDSVVLGTWPNVPLLPSGGDEPPLTHQAEE